MRIGMILNAGRPFPPDIRVEKESKALTDAGHQVTVFTEKIGPAQVSRELLPDGKTQVVRAEVGKPANAFARLWDRIRLVERDWLQPLDEFIRSEKLDALHVHDLLMVPTVLRAARQYGIPVVADLHENMPAAQRAYRFGQPLLEKLKMSVQYNYCLMRWHEARSLKQCCKVIVVVPEAMERLRGYGLAPEKIVVVSNTEDETTFSFRPTDSDPTILEQYAGYWVASYIGGIGPHRGLDTTLHAVPFLVDEIPDFRLLIVGAGERQQAQIRVEMVELGIEDKVEVLGWQPFERVNSYVMASQVCLVPHNDFEHTQTTVPHKLFQYMICKKPVLVSDCKPLERVVSDAGAGIVFKANDSRDMAEKLTFMYRNPALCETMGEQGQQAALGKYAWKNDARELIRLYDDLLAQE